MERHSPQNYAGPIDTLTRGRSRVWLLGTHVWPDWQAIRRLLEAHGFHVERYQVTNGAILILYTRS